MHTHTHSLGVIYCSTGFKILSFVLHCRSTVQPIVAYFQVSGGFSLLYLGIYALTLFQLIFQQHAAM